MADSVLHPLYMPFREAQLAEHFAPVAGRSGPAEAQRHLTYYRVEGEVAYIVWHANCASAEVALGTDTFVVRDGKIAVQTFAAKINPK